MAKTPGEGAAAAAVGAGARHVRVLPAALADQIAAGEVVERPASVVKELVENALDAGATRIDVAVDGGGVTAIRVADDGAGMSREDAATAVLRHATSKIASPEDLAAIRTLGFRGEALPSIAAVARLAITTRPRDAGAEGTLVRVEGGGPAEVAPAGAPPGTTVEARDLFFNVPARRKFLKSELAERRAAIDAVTRIALCRPEVGFVLRFDGRAVIDAPPAGDGVEGAAERVRQLLGGDEAAPRWAFEAAGGSAGAGAPGEPPGEPGGSPERRAGRGGVRVRGFLGRPDHARARPDHLYLFVNGRSVRDRALQQAVSLGYARVVERGRWPSAVVMVELPPEAVDVNVHPQKHEVRFVDARGVFEAVRGAVERAVAQAPWAAGEGAAAGTRAVGAWSGWGAPRPLAPRESTFALLPPPALQDDLPFGVAERAAAYGTGAVAGTEAPAAADRAAPIAPPPDAPAPAADQGPACARPLRDGDASPERGFYGALRLVGQVRRTFLVCESPAALYLVDQHAAHERILFERLRAARAGQAVPVQPLLLPATVELPPALAAVAESAAPFLSAMGLELAPFGGNTWRVLAIPAALVRASPAALARDALEEVADEAPGGLAERSDAALARMACHGATRAGDLLDAREAARLLADLDQVENRGHCPHGRPIAVEITWTELERRTRRT